MMRRCCFQLEKLIIVESPNKVKKIQTLLSDPSVIPDWSFGGSPALKRITSKSGAEAAITMATSGHFMGLTELIWEVAPQSASDITTPSSSPATPGESSHTSSSRSTAATASENVTDKTPSIEARFNLLWETIPGRRIHDVLRQHLQEEMDRAKYSEIIVATDPDREGELIAMHVYQLVQKLFPNIPVPFSRAYMHSLTPEGVVAAMQQRSGQFDWNLAHAAEARHAMDRIFGFLGSTVVRHAHPLMRSIGRVQTPSLILIREREEKIKSFKVAHPPCYEVSATCTYRSAKGNSPYTQTIVLKPEKNSSDAAALQSVRTNEAQMKELMAKWGVSGPKGVESLSIVNPPQLSTSFAPPPEPFTMAALLTRGNRLFHFTSSRISVALQELFQHGFITYPRTDSTRIDAEALTAIYKAVEKEFGEKMVHKRRVEAVQGRKGGHAESADGESGVANVEDAHEAIRPTNIDLLPKKLPSSLSLPAQQLYNLIRQHTLATCMIPIETEKVQVLVQGRSPSGVALHFTLDGRHTVQEGWGAAFTAGAKKSKGRNAKNSTEDLLLNEEEEEQREEGIVDVKPPTRVVTNEEFDTLQQLPSKARDGREGELEKVISLTGFQLRECPASPPLLYTEGSLIADLRRHGVGRPSTYPLIVNTLVDRQYIRVNGQGRCESTDVGKLLGDVSRRIFPSIVDIGFTSRFEKQLDRIAKPPDTLGAPEGVPSSPSEPSSTAAAGTPGSDSASAVVNATSTRAPLSPMDRVLSQFASAFLSYVVEATKQQRADLADRSLTILSTSGGATGSGAAGVPVTPPPSSEMVLKARERAMSLVPDLLRMSTQYKTFTAVQSNLREYLWRNFPKPSKDADGNPLPESDPKAKSKPKSKSKSKSKSKRKQKSPAKPRKTKAKAEK